jgi:glucose-1-phosphate thymidylyltransferase
MERMKGVILHGGLGTKLRPLTHTGPKQLIPIANKPSSQYVLEDLKASGITEIALVLGNIFPEKVKEYYSDGDKFSVKIQHIQQEEPKGIAPAVQLCKEYVKGQLFVVYLGDNMLKGGIARFVNKFQDSDYDAMILLCQVKNPERFGVAKINQKGKLVKLVEKPMKPPSNYALTGIYFFKPAIFDLIEKLKPSRRGELEITEAIQLLLESGNSVGYEIVQGWWKDTGTPEDILEANRLVLDELRPEAKGEIENRGSIQGRVTIDKGSNIREGALVSARAARRSPQARNSAGHPVPEKPAERRQRRPQNRQEIQEPRTARTKTSLQETRRSRKSLQQTQEPRRPNPAQPQRTGQNNVPHSTLPAHHTLHSTSRPQHRPARQIQKHQILRKLIYEQRLCENSAWLACAQQKNAKRGTNFLNTIPHNSRHSSSHHNNQPVAMRI